MTAQPVLFIQGAGAMREPEGSGVLADYLESSLGSDFKVVAPEMPGAASDPHYVAWRDRIEAELKGLEDPVLLVGHSFGGSTLLKFLAEGPPPRTITALFLISVPWWGPEGWAYEEYALPTDFASRLPEMHVFLYHSRDDPHVPFTHLALYEERLPDATSRPIDGSEHSFMKGLPPLVDDIRRVAEHGG